jgi:hypothetical protein
MYYGFNGLGANVITQAGVEAALAARREREATEAAAQAAESAETEADGSNTLLWVGAGVGAVVLAGLIYLAVKG